MIKKWARQILGTRCTVHGAPAAVHGIPFLLNSPEVSRRVWHKNDRRILQIERCRLKVRVALNNGGFVTAQTFSLTDA